MEFFFGGEGGAVAPYGLRGGGMEEEGARSRPENYGEERRRVEEGGGEKRREGARSRLGDYGGGRLFGFV